METNGSIEKRLATLEREVAELKRHLHVRSANWLDELSGSMSDVPDEEFEKFIRYGQEIRKAQADPTD
jgi:hypothetical protein